MKITFIFVAVVFISHMFFGINLARRDPNAVKYLRH
jgi:hypothetical protein